MSVECEMCCSAGDRDRDVPHWPHHPPTTGSHLENTLQPRTVASPNLTGVSLGVGWEKILEIFHSWVKMRSFSTVWRLKVGQAAGRGRAVPGVLSPGTGLSGLAWAVTRMGTTERTGSREGLDSQGHLTQLYWVTQTLQEIASDKWEGREGWGGWGMCGEVWGEAVLPIRKWLSAGV